MHLLGYAILASLIVYSLSFLIRFLFCKKRKKTFFANRWWVDECCDFGFNLVFTFILALILVLAFGGFSFWNAFAFLLAASFVVLVVKPSHWIHKIKDRAPLDEHEKRQFVFSFSMLAFLLLEMLAFNADAYKDHLASQSVDLSDSSIVFSSNVQKEANQSVSFPSDSYFIWTRSEATPARLQFVFSPNQNLQVDVTCSYSKDGNYYSTYTTLSCNPAVENSCCLELPEAGKYKTLCFTFAYDWARQPYGDHAGEGQSVSLSALRFDAPILFDFSLLRFALLSLLCHALIFVKPIAEHFNEKGREIHRKWELGVLLGGLSVLVVFVIYAFLNKNVYFSSYPLGRPIQNYDIYTQMFDAFKKGQLNIDAPVGDGIPLLWDHAYYGGKCYSYYGIAPVLLVSFPCYWLTHYVPKVLFLEVFGAILEVTLFLILIIEIARAFFKKMPLSALVFSLFMGVFLALSFGLVTAKSYYIGGVVGNPCVEGIYHIPTIYGMLNLDGFILCSLYAYQGKKRRMLSLAFAGLFFVFIMASRPNLFLCLIFVSPLLLKIVFEKGESWKKKLLAFAPMVVILLIGGFLIAKYNHDRFGSILEYGQRYQNTISNQTDLSVKPEQILPALMHFFLNPWTYNSSTIFPFIGTTNPHFTSDPLDYSFYLNWYSGVFSIPVFLSILTLPFTLKKGGDRWLDAFVLLLPITMGVLAIVTYSFAGLCPRYMFETYHLATLSSFIACFRLFEKREESRSSLLPIVFAFALASGFICWNLSNDPFFGTDIGDFSGLMLRVRGIFSIHGSSLPLFLVILVGAIQFEFVALKVFFPHRLQNQARKER